MKMFLQEVGWRRMEIISLVQDRDMWQHLVNAVINLQVVKNAGNFLTSRGRFSFSGGTLLHKIS
jgi:hypothetical protein